MNNDFIHVCFGLHDANGNYSVNVGTVMQSVIDNTSDKVHFHILMDDSVSDSNKSKLERVVLGTGHAIEFHYIDAEALNISGEFVKVYTVGALLRLLIPEVMSGYGKMIYFDADLLVNCDISDLWNIDISDVSIGAVHDKSAVSLGVGKTVVEPGYVKVEEYFNSGVLLLNLERIRDKGNLVSMVSDFLMKHPDSFWPDQDALNYIFSDDKKLLDDKWNTITFFERMERTELRDVIYHYAGDHFRGVYYLPEYDKKLLVTGMIAWHDYDKIHELYRVADSLKTHISINQKIMSLVSRRNVKCVFYGHISTSMQNLIDIVGVRYGDYFVLDDENHEECLADNIPTKSFNELRNEIKGAFVVFVLPEADGGEAIRKLTEIGLVRDEDYFVVPCVMTSDQGGYLY